MHIKFMSHGTGSAQGAADYLVQEKDHKGDVRPGIEIMRGDVNTFAQVADGLSFKNKYTSAVIAWSPEDKPTDEQIDEALDLYEKSSFAGLEPDRYCFAAVKHLEENGGVHVHIVSASVDLKTGKALNIAPPNKKAIFDDVRDHLNYKHDWSRPDDPQRAQTKSFERNGHEIGKTKDALHEYVTEGVMAGAVTDRESLKQWCSTADLEVSRESDKYISFKHGDSKPVRMKGAFYEREFKADTGSFEKEERGKCGVSAERAEELARSSYERLHGAIERRASYNRDRYKQREEKSVGVDQEIDRTQDERLAEISEDVELNSIARDDVHAIYKDRSNRVSNAFSEGGRHDLSNKRVRKQEGSGLLLSAGGIQGSEGYRMDLLQEGALPEGDVLANAHTKDQLSNEITELESAKESARSQTWIDSPIYNYAKKAYTAVTAKLGELKESFEERFTKQEPVYQKREPVKDVQSSASSTKTVKEKEKNRDFGPGMGM